MTKDEPAFPGCVAAGPQDDVYTSYSIGQVGLTKREYFAAMAMQGLLCHDDNGPDRIAGWAVSYADALIEELNK